MYHSSGLYVISIILFKPEEVAKLSHTHYLPCNEISEILYKKVYTGYIFLEITRPCVSELPLMNACPRVELLHVSSCYHLALL